MKFSMTGQEKGDQTQKTVTCSSSDTVINNSDDNTSLHT
jgi:hypothetical protein